MRVVEVEVERVVPGGQGLARLDGRIVLVPGALPGERVRVEITSEHERLLRARLHEVVSRSPARLPDERICPRALERSCGGCDWPHVAAEAERELKSELVQDALRRIGKLTADDVPRIGFVPSPPAYRLRNRLHVSDVEGPASGNRAAAPRVGFFAASSHEIADISPCRIVSEHLLARLPEIREAFAGSGCSGELTTLEGRAGVPFVVRFDSAGPVRDPRELALRLRRAVDGVEIGVAGKLVASEGSSAVTLEAGGARFRVSVTSFFQGNRHLLEAFLDEIRAALDIAASDGPIRRAADIYAGVGFLSWPLIGRAANVDAVEADRSAATDLQLNAREWRGARALRGTAERYVGSLPRDLDVLIADPPRAGMSPPVRAAIAASGPRSVLLVSCDPATLARDLAALKGRYEIRRFTLLDLFPSTHHVESVVLLRRRP